MDVSPVLEPLVEPGWVVVNSDAELAERVRLNAKKLSQARPAYGPRKAVTEIPEIHGQTVEVTPFELLHEVGRATVFQQREQPRDYQRLWAQLRYCDAFGHGDVGLRTRLLCLTEDALAMRFHHATTQSEYLGIGFAIVMARHVLSVRHPGWTWIAVDAEMALDAGFDLPRVRRRPVPRRGTSMRPDYFLLGHRADGRRSQTRLVVLESKGTHYGGTAVKQMGKAAFQLDSVRIGAKTPPGLMVATVLGRSRIVVNMLDPDGGIDLWDGDSERVDERLEQLNLAMMPPPPDDGAAPAAVPSSQQLALFGDDPAPVVAPAPAATGQAPPITQARIFPIPAEKTGWFTRVLSHTAAAAAALFAGNSALARTLMTERQRGRTHGVEPDSLDRRDTGVGVCVGATHRLHWFGDHYMEIFHGLDVDALAAVEQTAISDYVRRIRPGSAQIAGDGDEIVVKSRDGSVTGFRLRSHADIQP
jgi:hypothetical protein